MRVDGARQSVAAPASGLDTLPVGRAMRRRDLDDVRDLMLRPVVADLGRRNRLSNFGFFLLAAAGGSAASVVAILLASWALISVALGRFRWRLARSDLPVVGSMLLFLVVIGGSNVYHAVAEGGATAGEAAEAAGKLMLFVTPLFLVPRMRLSRFQDTLPPAFLGIAYGGVLLVPICILYFLYVDDRVAGLAGNPGPLSVTGLLTTGWSVLALTRRTSRRHVAVAILGALGGALAVILSGMRGAWPALPIVLFVSVFAQRREIGFAWRRATRANRTFAVGIALGVVGIAVFAVAPLIAARIDATVSDLSLIFAKVDTATSLNLRRGMYEAAAQAIAARPWFGYGDAAHWTAIMPYVDSKAFRGISYSHLHNIVLTVGVDAGLIGIAALCAVVAAPLWTGWRARRRLGGSRRLAAALVLVVAFLVPGMSNIMFFHDILDAVWAFSVSLIAASVPAETER